MKCRVSVFRICVKLGSEARLGSPFCVLVSFKEEEESWGNFSSGSCFVNSEDQVNHISPLLELAVVINHGEKDHRYS